MDLRTVADRAIRQKKRTHSLFFRSDLAPQLTDKLNEIFNEDIDREARYVLTAQEVVNYLLLNGHFFKLSTDRHRDALYLDDKHNYYYQITSDAFVSWLAQLTGINRASKHFEFVKVAVEDCAIGRPTPTVIPKSYWWVTDKTTYITYKNGLILRINKNGHKIVNNGTDSIVFPISSFLAPWELQDTFSDPFTTLPVFKEGLFANDWGCDLVKLWTLAIFCLPTYATKPILLLQGDGRSGKTLTAKTIMAMLGLPGAPESVTGRGKDEETFWLKVDRGGILAIDNIDDQIDWLSNALCCASSASSHTHRALYTDRTEIEYHPNSWILATSINPVFANNTSLTDRMVIVHFRRRDGSSSRRDTDLNEQATQYHSHIMSWIVDQVERYYREPLIECDIYKRDPKFSAMAATLAKIWGQEDRIHKALAEGEFDKTYSALINNKVGTMIMMQARKTWAVQPFEGDAQALLCLLKDLDCTFNLTSTKELLDEMRKLGGALSKHVYYSTSGDRNNPWFKIGGLKDNQDDFRLDYVPAFSDLTGKTSTII